MMYSFNCCGHENITARHRTTFEFTKEADLSMKGDCIIGVCADFDLEGIKRFIEKLGSSKVTITIETIITGYNNKYCNEEKNNFKKNISEDETKSNFADKKIIEKINAEVNPGFNSGKEMVIRKTGFISERTFAVNADKAAFELNRDLAGFLKEKENRIRVIVENAQ